ncbi:MAG: triosephosphate isomerase [Tenericutes bacterium]|nr:triosephosphate isomerase [Mycoplasmatota bacterium]
MKIMIVGNHKNNLLANDIKNYLEIIKKYNSDKVELIICPTSIYIPYFLGKGFKVGIQNLNVSGENLTGEVTPFQAKSLNINYVIIGHYNRRFQFNEDDILINKKIKSALNAGIKIILCIGESREQKALNKLITILPKQIDKALMGIGYEDLNNIVIAYEPIWSIGTDIIPTNEELLETISFIKNYILKKYDVNIRVLYGGSVDINNINKLLKVNNLDGFLIGAASLDANKMINMIEKI